MKKRKKKKKNLTSEAVCHSSLHDGTGKYRNRNHHYGPELFGRILGDLWRPKELFGLTTCKIYTIDLLYF